MREGNRPPPSVSLRLVLDIDVKFDILSLFEFLEDHMDMLEVGAQNSALVRLPDLENQQFQPRSVTFLANLEQSSVEEIVEDDLVGVEDEVDLVGFGTEEELGEVGVLDGQQGTEVGVNFSVELIFLHVVVELGNCVQLVSVKFVS